MQKQFHVYQLEKDGEWLATETTGCNTASKVNAILPQKNMNWYGTTAKSKEEAIAEAKRIAPKGLYRDPERMKKLEEKAKALKSQVEDFFV